MGDGSLTYLRRPSQTRIITALLNNKTTVTKMVVTINEDILKYSKAAHLNEVRHFVTM